MKYFLSFIFILNSFIVIGQDFYINVQNGYGFATPNGQMNYYNVDDNFHNSTQEVVKGGLGEGFYSRLNTGYNYSKLVSFECSFNYLRGRFIEFTHKYSSVFDPDFVSTKNASQSINAFIFSPQLVFKLPSKYKFQPYLKTGIAVGLFMKSQIIENFNNYYQGTSTFELLIERELEGGTSLGFTTTFGTQYPIYKNLILVMDCNLLNMAYRPYKNTITTYIRDNIDEYNSLSLWEREINYTAKVEENLPIDSNAAKKMLPISLPMSNLSFNIGLQVSL